jgi:type VII secretion integral membrane protein EccD
MAGVNVPTSSGEVCRLTICGPTSRIELAVPAHVPLTDLLPTFLGHLGSELAMVGLGHDGWILQRLGEPPLEEDLAASALGLYDGDVVYLRPRNDQLPPVDFDDLVDGVATGIADRSDRWKPDTTRRLLLTMVGVVLGLGIAIAPESGTGNQVSATTAVAGLVLLLGAAAASRALADRMAGRVLAVGAIGFFVIAGLALPAGGRLLLDGPGLLTAPGVLAAGVWAASAAILARIAIGGSEPGFTGATLTAVLAALGGLTVTVAGVDAAGGAAIVLAVAVLLGALVPMAASRLAGLRIPPLPTNSDEFQNGIDPEPSSVVLARTALAHDYITALCLGLGAVCAVSLPVLGSQRGISAPVLALIASLLLLLHSRELIGIQARLAGLVPGVIGLGTLALTRAVRADLSLRPLAVLATLAVAGILLAFARLLPGRRLLPHWGRIADLTQSAAAMAIIPLVPAVIGLYAKVRAGWA